MNLCMRSMRRSPFLFLIIVLLISVYPANAARVAAYISGKVTDSRQAPLEGVNVSIVGSRLGASTDARGEYRIFAVPPGKLTLRFDAIGYRSHTIEGIVVELGCSEEYNVELRATTLSMEPVTVRFEPPAVHHEMPYQRTPVDGGDVRGVAVNRADEMLQFQAGVTLDDGGDVHVRGGRKDEVVYYVDGMRVEDPLAGKRAANIGREALNAMELITGTFGAEYGDAMSGVINIRTREGGEEFHGSAEYESSMLNDSPYREKDWAGAGIDSRRSGGESAYASTDVFDAQSPWIPTQGRYSATLSGPVKVLPNTYFFVHGLHTVRNGELPFNDKWVRRVTGKVNTSTERSSWVLSFGFRGRDGQSYSHSWKYVPEHYYRKFERNNRVSLGTTWNLGQNVVYEGLVGVYNRSSDKKLFETWSEYLDAGYARRTTDRETWFKDGEDWSDKWTESDATTVYTTHKLSWYPSRQHHVLGGIEWRENDLSMLEIDDLDVGAGGEQLGICRNFSQKPREIATFIQDQMRFGDVNVQAGLRMDVIDPNMTGWKSPVDQNMVDVKKAFNISPRLGAAWKATDELSLYAGYGQYFQYPNYVDLYLNTDEVLRDEFTSGNITEVGNPELEPETTNAFEAGMKWEVTRQTGVVFTVFHKDVDNLVAAKTFEPEDAPAYEMMDNLDEARISGVEVQLLKRFSGRWNFQGNYTYTISEQKEGDWVPLTWSRPHVVNMIATWRDGALNHSNAILRGVGAGIILNLASGLPYTPLDVEGKSGEKNSERMAVMARLDLRLSKSFAVGNTRLTLFTNIDNVLDRENPLVIDRTTGEPWETTRDVAGEDIDRLYDPSRVDIPRMVRAGVTVEF